VWEKLQASGEEQIVQARHLEFYIRLGDEAAGHLRSAGQLAWLDRLETEHDNLRAALDWALGQGRATAGLRLAGALALFWYLRGYWSEGNDWLRHMLAAPVDAGGLETPEGREAAQARARALYGAGWLADERGKEAALYEEGLQLCRELGDRWGEAFCLRGLGVWSYNQNNEAEAARRLDESLGLFQQTGDPWGIALVRFNQGWLASGRNDPEGARAVWEEGLGLFRQVGDRWGIAVTLDSLGYLARSLDEYKDAARLSREALSLFRELGDKAGMSTSLLRLGSVAYRRDDYPQAVSLFQESLALSQEMGYRWDAANTMRFLGMVACYQGDYERASTLLDESLVLFQQIGIPLGSPSGSPPGLFMCTTRETTPPGCGKKA
jgi:tetratricopeptide (TPR) repeat protein